MLVLRLHRRPDTHGPPGQSPRGVLVRSLCALSEQMGLGDRGSIEDRTASDGPRSFPRGASSGDRARLASQSSCGRTHQVDRQTTALTSSALTEPRSSQSSRCAARPETLCRSADQRHERNVRLVLPRHLVRDPHSRWSERLTRRHRPRDGGRTHHSGGVADSRTGPDFVSAATRSTWIGRLASRRRGCRTRRVIREPKSGDGSDRRALRRVRDHGNLRTRRRCDRVR